MTTYEQLDLTYKGNIANGTFGRVDLAWSCTTKRYFAVKIFNIHEVVQQGHNEYINRERNIMRSLDNPFIVKLICTNIDRASLYLVMDFAEGGELRDYLGDMNENELCDAVRFYSVEIISALRHIHSKNIVYRDLKPENLLLSKSGHIKVSDFGLAKVLKGKTYTICGTAEYMAPEILSKKGYGQEVDWWSLGVVIFELISGSPPFAGSSDQETTDAVQKRKLQSYTVLKEEIREVLERLLNRDVAKRCADLSTLKWYTGIDFENISDAVMQPPFEPAPFDTKDLLSLNNSEEPLISMQKERDLFADW